MTRTLFARAALLGVVVLIAGSAVGRAGSIMFDVKTTVGGNADTKIGSITASMAGPSAADPDADFVETGTFTFAAPWGQLDDCYDFRWFQIITSAPAALLTDNQLKFKDKDGNFTVAPATPFVDPPAGGYQYQDGDGGADNDPFYENSGNGNYAYPNHSDRSTAGVSVWTDDYPTPEDVFFETYLVVTGGDIGANKFAVLAGYKWNTDLDANDHLADPDPVEILPANFSLPTLQSALTGSGFKAQDYNNAWTAVTGVDLEECPEPSTIVLGLIAGVFLLGVARRRRPAIVPRCSQQDRFAAQG